MLRNRDFRNTMGTIGCSIPFVPLYLFILKPYGRPNNQQAVSVAIAGEGSPKEAEQKLIIRLCKGLKNICKAAETIKIGQGKATRIVWAKAYNNFRFHLSCYLSTKKDWLLDSQSLAF